MTQQNAAMVEQTTAASHSLSQDARQLASLIGQFKIGQMEAKEAESMRRELEKIAPHAFRLPSKASPAAA